MENKKFNQHVSQRGTLSQNTTNLQELDEILHDSICF